MSDPRFSDDASVRRALEIWDQSQIGDDAMFNCAIQLHADLEVTGAHRAVGWAALTCGRLAACRGDLNAAESYLSKAMGYLHFANDKYGEALVDAHIAVTLAQRGESARALKFAMAPLHADIAFGDFDRSILYNIAAMCSWRVGECHQAIGHLLSEFELITKLRRKERHAFILGNLGAVLLEIGEFELALAASKQGWELQIQINPNQKNSQFSSLANIVLANHLLGRKADAREAAYQLMERLDLSSQTSRWMSYLCAVDAFSASGEVAVAQSALDRAKTLSAPYRTPGINAQLSLGEAAIFEARKDYKTAARLAKQVLDLAPNLISRCDQIGAALVYSRSCDALGRKAEADKWQSFASDARQQGLLNDILTARVRASLNVNPPTFALTDQELSCLRLSAYGQSSTDIGQKLGITARTVNFHFSKILRKLNAANRQEAIAMAVSANLITLPSKPSRLNIFENQHKLQGRHPKNIRKSERIG